MSSKSRLLIFVCSTPLVLLVAVGGLLGAQRPEPQSFAHLRVFNDVVQLIEQAYVEPVDIDKVMEGAMRGLAEGLDAASVYLSPEEVKAIETNAVLPAGDVGLIVTRQFYLRIVGVVDGSPAARAGLRTGDYIRGIDKTPTRDLSAFTGMRMLRGAPGSKVALTIIRGSAADPHEMEIVREVVKPADVATVTKQASGTAYVRLSSFGAGAATSLRTAFTKLQADSSVKGAILDLRGLADGTAADGVAAAKLFVKSGTLATAAGRGADKTVTTAAAGDGAITMPVALLVSNGTANAAEIFASALSGNKRAELVGEPTAGIAGVQKLVKLPEGRGLWLTYQRYLANNGDPIHERGLRPDVSVEEPTVPFGEAPPTTDTTLAKAIERLSSKKAA